MLAFTSATSSSVRVFLNGRRTLSTHRSIMRPYRASNALQASGSSMRRPRTRSVSEPYPSFFAKKPLSNLSRMFDSLRATKSTIDATACSPFSSRRHRATRTAHRNIRCTMQRRNERVPKPNVRSGRSPPAAKRPRGQTGSRPPLRHGRTASRRRRSSARRRPVHDHLAKEEAGLKLQHPRVPLHRVAGRVRASPVAKSRALSQRHRRHTDCTTPCHESVRLTNFEASLPSQARTSS